ncbi:hypothetical protein MMC22_007896 [Lobaria immixta]|nr:hypothetical protein [Lobaria immixta]
MDDSKRGFLRLPLELRQQIYEMYFDACPTPSILRVNRLVHDESIHFIRKLQLTFTFNVSGKGAGFDDFSKWCFRIKHHTPKLSGMKHIILNIHPPDQNRPYEMVHIWEHLQGFCKEIAAQWRILQLTVKFVESDGAGWATNGVLHSTMGLGDGDEEDFSDADIGQILLTLYRFVDNVEKPRVILPFSHKNDLAQSEADYTEDLMTGRFKDEDAFEDYELLERRIGLELSYIKLATGRKSKALFEKKYGQNVILEQHQLNDLKRQWPHMDDLPDWERPRFRIPCTIYDCVCVRSYVHISMPDAEWGPSDWALLSVWRKDRLIIVSDGTCHYYAGHGGYQWEPFIPKSCIDSLQVKDLCRLRCDYLPLEPGHKIGSCKMVSFLKL